MFYSVTGINGEYYVKPVYAHGQLTVNRAVAGPFPTWERAERAIPVLTALNTRLR